MERAARPRCPLGASAAADRTGGRKGALANTSPGPAPPGAGAVLCASRLQTPQTFPGLPRGRAPAREGRVTLRVTTAGSRSTCRARLKAWPERQDGPRCRPLSSGTAQGRPGPQLPQAQAEGGDGGGSHTVRRSEQALGAHTRHDGHVTAPDSAPLCPGQGRQHCPKPKGTEPRAPTHHRTGDAAGTYEWPVAGMK